MKIAITAQGESQMAAVDERFGRTQGFYIYDDEKNTGEYIDNRQNMESAQGAGIQAAGTVINSGATVLITGNVGPKAYAALSAAGIEIYTGVKGTVWDAIDEYKSGLLTKSTEANVEGHW